MRKDLKVAIVLIVIVIITGLFFDLYTSKIAKERGVYVIGTIEKVEGARANLRGFVQFNFRGKVFLSDFLSNEISHDDFGKRYFIKIIPSCPKCYLSFDSSLVVPDSIKESPFSGWQLIPR